MNDEPRMKRLPVGYWFSMPRHHPDPPVDFEALRDDVVVSDSTIRFKLVETAREMMERHIPVCMDQAVLGHGMYGDPVPVVMAGERVMLHPYEGVVMEVEDFDYMPIK